MKKGLWVGLSMLVVAMGPALGSAGPLGEEGNPMAFVGEQHNHYLGCLLQLDVAERKDPFEALVERCGFDAGMTGGELSRQYSPLVPGDLLASLDTMLEPWRGQFSQEQYAYLAQMEHVLATQAPEAASVSLEALEAEAVRALGREKADLAVLAGLSTARSSLSFWTSRSPQAGLMRIRWWQIVLADAVGGAVGGFFGGGFGAVGLGVGCSELVSNLR